MSHDISVEASGDRNQLVESPSARDHRQGSLNARVVLVEYGDYQCPQCGELYVLIETIYGQLNGTFPEENYLCFVFRQFPQPQLYPQAQKAAAAALAAGAQGQFWQMHDMLFNHQQALGNGYLVEYADRLGLNIPQFLQEMTRQVYVDRINKDIESGLQSGVTTAPALFINGTRYRDRWNIEQLITAIVAASP
ncbi:MAG: DsbA family protein [Microcoleus sp. PH2017_29_MFU_D_A]|uniref:DsbA family protein n=1 Tax=unclassified Microcoleus TaxID=2642155 RepID=UPI001DCBC6B7|nr:MULTISPECIES: DsbA family protein [unclassified Microcoleus]MCC3606818.1 DsbA family protein [Microcoleus sp. PH2017_29_MFU_D_A]MCC3637865.1 DsbA family protein [Microcoleus sp. PH2017_37_MFU_D_B]